MLKKFLKLPLAIQFNLAMTALIATLISVAGYVSVNQSTHALLESEKKSLRNTVAASANLLATPFETLQPLVANFASQLSQNFSGTFTLDSSKTESVGGKNVPALFVGGQKVTKDFSIVDDFSERWGAPATVFQRVGDDFLRVSTSLKDGRGKRAFGTWLGSAHPGYQLLMNGQTYVGHAHLFGKHYITQYEPVTENGQVVAILFVGVDVTSSVNSAFSALAEVTIGDSGYLYVIDSNGKVLHHPKLETGTAIQNIKAADGSSPGDKILNEKSGALVFPWKGTNGNTSSKLATYDFSEAWNWIVVGEAFEHELIKAANAMALNLSIIYAAGTLLIVIAGLVLARRLLSPLRALVGRIEKIGRGDLINHGLAKPATNSDNEIDRITNSMHDMVGSLRSLVSSISEVSEGIASISQSACQHANEQQTISSRLSAESDQAATGIEEMSASFREVALNVNKVADSSNEIDAASGESSAGMLTLFQSTDSTTARINEVSLSITKLSNTVQNITKAVELIRSIAEQTNLLALNAAIEAARAGDQGRGFAVVADEVRNLAKRTQDSTNEIGEVVEFFLKATQEASSSMESALSDMQLTRDKANDSRALLDKVSTMTSGMNIELETIAAAVTEQSQVAEQVAEIQNKVNQIAATSYEKSSDARGSATHLNELTENLKSSLARFSI